MSATDFMNIFSHSPLPMYIFQNGSFRAVNLKMSELTGYTAEELNSLPFAKLAHPEDLPMLLNDDLRRLAGEEVPDHLEWRAVTRRGEIIYLQGFYSCVEFNGRPAVLGQIIDITGQKRAAEELDLQKAYFQQLFENSPEGIVILDSEDRFIAANRGFEKLFQYSFDEIRGRYISNVIIPENMVEEAEALSQKAMGGEIVQLETVRRRKDGSLVDVSILAYPISLGGRQAGIYVMYSDITERKRVHEKLQAINEQLEAANEEMVAAEEELKQQFAELQRSEQALRESEQRFRLLFHKANDGIVLAEVTDNKELGRFIEVNDVVCKRLGYGRDEFLAMKPADIVAKEHLGEIPAVTQAFLSRGIITFETSCVAKNGKKIPFEISGHIFSMNEMKVGLLVVRDITDRKLAEEKLRTANQQLQDIIEFLPDATFAVDKDRKIIAWNRAIEEMTGVCKEQIIGMGDYVYTVPFYGKPRPALIDLLFSDDGEIKKLYDHIERKGDTLYTEAFVPSLFEGKGAYIWVKTSPLFDSNGNMVGAIESIRDITDRKKVEQRLKYLSLHDPLTGLYNRAYFEEEMRRLGGGRRSTVSIIVCDIDGLKLVNDTLGHRFGDDLLVAAAGVIREPFRGGDMIARIGGDEFAVLLPNCDRKTVESACSRIKTSVAKYNAANPDLPLSMSIGSATSMESPLSPGNLFKEADNNMYREKLHRSQSARSAIVQTLMKALEARDFITEGHADRLQDLAVILAVNIGLPERSAADLRLLAQFHDIGKVGISDRILFKPGPLTPDEVAEMRRHCEIGHRIAHAAPDMAHIADWILKHHEWWDGNGYPIGLKGEEIPLECRILAIIDAYDAMTSDRPYRRALSHEEAVAELRMCAGRQFDPQLVPVFVQVLEEQKKLL